VALVVAVVVAHVVLIDRLLIARQSALPQALAPMLVTMLDLAGPPASGGAGRAGEPDSQTHKTITPPARVGHDVALPDAAKAHKAALVPQVADRAVPGIQAAPRAAPRAAPNTPAATERSINLPRSSAPPPAGAELSVAVAGPAPTAPLAATPANPSSGSPAAVAKATPGEGGGDSSQPLKLSSASLRYLVAPRLEYPAASRELGESGVVLLKLLIDEQGRPQDVEVAKSSGFPRLDQQALQAMRGARFQPRVVEGVARSVITTAALRFNLED
jgi:protein TonB